MCRLWRAQVPAVVRAMAAAEPACSTLDFERECHVMVT